MNTKKVITAVLALAIMSTSFTAVPENVSLFGNVSNTVSAVSAVSITESGADFEAAYVEWTAVSGAEGYNVYYRSAGSTSYIQLDTELIREYKNYWRADMVGLAAGSYTLKVVPVVNSAEDTSAAAETSSLAVSAYDRSGFAHSNVSEGVGAYNDDGTLKSDAVVLYITETTKNTVTMDVQTGSSSYTSCTGLTEILNALQKGYETRPIAIRLIGKLTPDGIVGAGSDTDNLLVKASSSSRPVCDITVEGIGEDATCYGFGIRLVRAQRVEIRNVGIMLFGDDGLAMQDDNKNIWIHNNDVFYGTAGSDSDQAKGDGSMDLKNDSQYVTISFNHFWDSGKMSLCGMKSETGENFISYHHNWFDHSDSRHPRIRTMSVHVYNNYYDGNAKYGVGVTMGASAFVEANYFRNCPYPMMSSGQGTDALGEGTFSGETGGVIKAYNNYMEGVKSYIAYSSDNTTEFDAYEVSSADETVPSSVVAADGGTSYSNFDTSSSMYEYTADDPMDVPEIVMAGAGRMNGGDFEWEFDDSTDDSDYSVNLELMAAIKAYSTDLLSVGGNSVEGTGGEPSVTEPIVTTTPTDTTTSVSFPSAVVTDAPSSNGYVHNFTTDGTSSSYFTIAGSVSTKTTNTFNGLTLTEALKMDSTGSISFTVSSDNTKVTLVVNCKSDGADLALNGESVTELTDLTTSVQTVTLTLDAGNYSITKKNGESYIYYIAVSDTGAVSSQTSSDIVTSGTDMTTVSVTTSAPIETQPTETTPIAVDAIYCSPTASVSGKGTVDDPTTIENAISMVEAGGVIYLLGGTYSCVDTILIDEDNSGTESAMKTIRNYPGESVVIDFTGQEVSGSSRGFVLAGSYWHFYGIEITKAGDNGMLLAGNHNLIEMCVFNNNQDTGLQISRYDTSKDTIDQWPSYNTILNCTSKNNCDEATMENADGFAAKLTCGEGNVFDGCMAYNNSDDGWDLFAKSETGSIGVVTIKNSIAFRNGYTEDGRGYGDCDGNGFKLGGSGIGTAHIVENCLAFENLNSGFTDNNNPLLGSLTNCTAYNNGVGGNGKSNYMTYRCTDCDFTNLISYNNESTLKDALAPDASAKISNDKFVGTMENSIFYNGGKYYNVTSSTAIDNGDKIGDIITLTADDFVSLEVGAMGTDFHSVWRNADGSINTHGFMELAKTSLYSGLGSSFESNETVDNVVTTTVSETEPTVTTTVSETEPTVTTTVSESESTVTTTVSESESTVTTTVSETEPIITTTTVSESGDTQSTLLGDANGDSKISSIDLIVVKKHLLESQLITDSQLYINADMDGNGNLTVIDLISIKKLLLG